MGHNLFDQYSLLHFATGVIFYFWGVSFRSWNLIHIIFEILENTDFGVNFIGENIKWWPGGKVKPDHLINSVGDVISGAIGWLVAYYLDKIGTKKQWYSPHLL